MIFTPASIDGVWVIDLEPITDERGFFARSWCAREFSAHGLATRTVQCSIAFNRQRGTIRGLHYADPALTAEARLVRCTRGAVWDVVADLRPSSSTFGQWVGIELSEVNRRALYIAPGLAHGYQTLQDDTELVYQMSDYYRPEASRSVRWDDATLGISWPLTATIISDADRSAPVLRR